MLHGLVHLLSHFCRFPINPGRTTQKSKQPQLKSTQPNHPTRWTNLYMLLMFCLQTGRRALYSVAKPPRIVLLNGVVDNRENMLDENAEQYSEDEANFPELLLNQGWISQVLHYRSLVNSQSCKLKGSIE